MLPSPFDRRVGIRIRTFEACSGFTHVTAHRIAQPPKAAFVTRLQPCQLPDRTARQLPDQSTTLWVESSSTSDPRLRRARSKAPFWLCANHFIRPPRRATRCENRTLSHQRQYDESSRPSYGSDSENIARHAGLIVGARYDGAPLTMLLARHGVNVLGGDDCAF